MNPALVALAIAIVAGGVLAVSSRDIRSVVLGLLVVLASASLVAVKRPSGCTTSAIDTGEHDSFTRLPA